MNISSPNQSTPTNTLTTMSPCIWVGNVCESLGDETLMELFGVHGPVLLLRRLVDSHTAFITYLYNFSALQAKQQMEGQLAGSIRLTINTGTVSRSLWVGNISTELSEFDITRFAVNHIIKWNTRNFYFFSCQCFCSLRFQVLLLNG